MMENVNENMKRKENMEYSLVSLVQVLTAQVTLMLSMAEMSK